MCYTLFLTVLVNPCLSLGKISITDVELNSFSANGFARPRSCEMDLKRQRLEIYFDSIDFVVKFSRW